MKKLLSSIFLSLSLALSPMLSWAQTKSYALPRAVVGMLQGDFGSCSGVRVAPERVLTAFHCLDASKLFDGRYTTEVLRAFPEADLLLLKVEGMNCPCVPVGNTAALDTDVIAVGYPLGLHQIVTEGSAQGKLKSDEPRINGFDVFSAQAEGGFSGGGIFQQQNGKWKLVAITSIGSKTITAGPGPDKIQQIF